MTVKEIRDALAPLKDKDEIVVLEIGAPFSRVTLEEAEDRPGYVLWVPDSGIYTYQKKLEQKIRALRAALAAIME